MSDRLHVIATECPGSGRSPTLDGTKTFLRIAAVLEAITTGLDPPSDCTRVADADGDGEPPGTWLLANAHSKVGGKIVMLRFMSPIQ